MIGFTPLLLALLPVALSAPHAHKEPTITSFAGQYSCPAQLLPFHASTSMLIPGTSAERVWQELGDFCDVEWQGFEIVSTKGQCNSHRSLRTYRAADLDLTERLDFIHLPSTSTLSPLIPAVFSRSRHTIPKVYAHGFTMLNRPTLAGADVIRMKSLLKVVETKSGARVTWDVMGCSDYPEHLADKLEEVHEGALFVVESRIREEETLLKVQPPSLDADMDLMEQLLESATLA